MPAEVAKVTFKCELVQQAKDNYGQTKWTKFGLIRDKPKEGEEALKDGDIHDLCGKICGLGQTLLVQGKHYEVTITEVTPIPVKK